MSSPEPPARVFEDPCETDGKPCVWISEEVDDDGAWDLYCEKCFRFRDWTKEPLPDDKTKA